MEEQFFKFLENITLTTQQREDAKTKYAGVCKKLHDAFYAAEYSGQSKFLFGSYKTKTHIRPFPKSQDVDMIFKIDEETWKRYDKYDGNGQSALLQKIREILKEKYTLTEKIRAWGKVVLVEMSEGKHNVEVLPAFERTDGTFLIPNTENGGSWEVFDPKKELKKIDDSNSTTSGVTRHLCKMIKRWNQEVSGCFLKSYQIQDFVIEFLKGHDLKEFSYSSLVHSFFLHIKDIVSEENKSFVETAITRAQKAVDYEEEEKYESATEEWKKIFGNQFPSRSNVYNSLRKFTAIKEEFIEDKFRVEIDPQYKIAIDCEVEQNGFQKTLLSLLPFLKKDKKLEFFFKHCNIPAPFDVHWKVRNFGKEAETANQIRGEISSDQGRCRKKETTRYHGEHLVECYIIKNGVCVAKSKIIVPINTI
jgi:hypothetical protein